MQEELPRVEDSDYGSKGQTESHVAVTTLFLISVFQNASVWVSSPWFSMLQLSCYKHAKQCLRRPQRIRDLFNLYIMGSPCVDAHLFFQEAMIACQSFVPTNWWIYLLLVEHTDWLFNFESKDWSSFGLQLGLEGRSMVAFLTMSLAMDNL